MVRLARVEDVKTKGETVKFMRHIAAAAALALSASVATAGTSNVNLKGDPSRSIRGQGSFTGSASFDSSTGLLTFVLDNTSASNMTGLAFNLAGTRTATYVDGDKTGTKGDDDAFDDARRGKHLEVKAKRFGLFEAGAGVDGKWGIGKHAKLGVTSGASKTFTFQVAGGGGMTAAELLSGDSAIVASFKARKKDGVAGTVSLISIDTPATGDTGGAGVTPPGTVVGGGSDSGNVGAGGSTPVAIPLPPAVWSGLASMGGMGLAFARRRWVLGR